MSLNQPPIKRPRTRGNSVLSQEEQMKIVCWFATYTSLKEVKELCKSEFGKELAETSLTRYRDSEEWEPVRKKIRDKWESEIFRVELVSKRKRLQELEKIYHEVLGKKNYKTALETLDRIKGEVEKTFTNLNLSYTNVNIFEDMSLSELEEEKIKSLDRIKLLKGESNDAGKHASQIPKA